MYTSIVHSIYHRSAAAFFLLLFFSIPFFAPGAASAEDCSTEKCHGPLLKGKYVHAVAEPCDGCHRAAQTPHPQPGKKTFALTQDMPGLCATCHSEIGKKKFVHTPVQAGMCASCHNPHSSNEQKLLTRPASELCVTCHADKQSYAFVHGPAAAGDCTTCHHPHESGSKGVVLQEGPGLCLACHVELEPEMKNRNVHPALLGGCSSCHNPHGGPVKKFLSAQGDKLCFQCHPQIGEKVTKAKVVHAPIKTERACASCHAPHASEGEKLLHKKGKDICLECHKDFIKKNWTVLHGPIKEGNCAACHDPHGAAYDRLLLDSYSSEQYIAYSDNEYKLCFKCHNRDLLRYPDTSFATGFRDGDKNLHYVHVNRKDKGRNCKLCHAVHGGELPKLLADKVPFGKWGLPLKFVKTETGGSCTPGCHKTFNYDRKSPGRAPEPAPSKDKAKETKEKGKR